jgi:hypothetical protein
MAIVDTSRSTAAGPTIALGLRFGAGILPPRGGPGNRSRE